MNNLNENWSTSLSSRLTSSQRDWLQRPGSLTQHLSALGTFSLDVIDEGHYPAGQEDASALNVDIGTPLWIRTVVMSVDDVPVVPARSAMTVEASHHEWNAARHQHDHPLGQILYCDPHITRSSFSWIELLPPPAPRRSLLADVVFNHPRVKSKAVPIWARRSVFHRDGAPMLIAEAFCDVFWARLPP